MKGNAILPCNVYIYQSPFLVCWELHIKWNNFMLFTLLHRESDNWETHGRPKLETDVPHFSSWYESYCWAISELVCDCGVARHNDTFQYQIFKTIKPVYWLFTKKFWILASLYLNINSGSIYHCEKYYLLFNVSLSNIMHLLNFWQFTYYDLDLSQTSWLLQWLITNYL